MIFCLWYWFVGIRLEKKAIKETKYEIRKLLKLPDDEVIPMHDSEMSRELLAQPRSK
jgi:hypothetical protein